MEYKFTELVDLSCFKNCLVSLFAISNPVLKILDTDGEILLSFGCQEICKKYHQAHCKTASLCRKCERYITNYFNNDEPYKCFICENGLIDASTPIMVNGEHVATAIHGQFLFEEPDLEKFRRQAKKYGFNEKEYLEALAKVPIYTKAELDSVMLNIRRLIETMAQNGLDHLRLLQSESETRLMTIIKNTPYIAIQSYDFNGNLQYCNKASEKMFDWEDDPQKSESKRPMIYDKKLGSGFPNLKGIHQTGKVIKEKEWLFRGKDGSEKMISSTLFPINFPDGKNELISMDIDITEKKHLEREIQRFDQLKLIGEMAAGIAHEIRNPMTTIRGYLQLLQNRKEIQDFKSQFQLMIEEIDRANEIITQFLSLAKTKPAETISCNLNDIIAKLFPLLQADAFTKNMEIIFEPGEIPNIHLNATEIHQLILNLCRNGLEAMNEGGCITLKTFVEGQNVVLGVRDEGYGIPVENLDKLGKPFFSTKDNGTGLGLASCINIATRHNAIIDIDSSPTGTTFSVRFVCDECV